MRFPDQRGKQHHEGQFGGQLVYMFYRLEHYTDVNVPGYECCILVI